MNNLYLMCRVHLILLRWIFLFFEQIHKLIPFFRFLECQQFEFARTKLEQQVPQPYDPLIFQWMQKLYMNRQWFLCGFMGNNHQNPQYFQMDYICNQELPLFIIQVVCTLSNHTLYLKNSQRKTVL
ncbi:Hypothetical_protein [Hexamita inflata]|uniref:Hypothetical_protein n=1 Tax=Hexamita inflata TaxID=28002 RepID=A0AA86NSV2_9EUKA|nr:Hypothetical protein HINF_LOCUS11846 [Hexamita inflata]